jgi:sugar O-acyltransferase (sialic acid O-acetyltransferase NeuD family)
LKRLLIIGAGASGREILCWAKTLNSSEWKIGGFLDDNLDALKDYDYPFEIISEASSYTPKENDLFVCSITSPQRKLEICNKIQSEGGKFINLIHSSVLMLGNTKLGNGCIFPPYSFISTDSIIEDFVYFNIGAGIGHDCVIGKGSTLFGGCSVLGNVKVGEGAIISGIHIGDYATIGAGSVVIKNVEPNVTMMGVPAKQIPNFNDIATACSNV